MKKAITILLLVLTLASCVLPASAEWYEDGNPPLSPEISLASNPTTGYQWLFTCDDEAVVSVCEHGFYSESEGLLGAGGVERFRLDGAGAGYAVITFRYARSWEEDALHTITYHVQVNEDWDVSIFQTDFQ